MMPVNLKKVERDETSVTKCQKNNNNISVHKLKTVLITSLREAIPGYTGRNASRPGRDLWGCTERIQTAVKGIGGLTWARGDWGGTKGRRWIEWCSKGRGRVHGWSWCRAPDSRRTAGGCRCGRGRPALRSWAERQIHMLTVSASSISVSV